MVPLSEAFLSARTGSVTRTGDLPDEIGGDVRQRHLDGDFVKIGEVVKEMGVERRLADLVVVDTALVVLAIFCYGDSFCGSRLRNPRPGLPAASRPLVTDHPPPLAPPPCLAQWDCQMSNLAAASDTR
jgi:hypothetical protein